MNLKSKILDYLSPVIIASITYGLGLVVPIPAPILSALVKAIVNGDITLDHIQAFLAARGIKDYFAPTDFPEPPANISNIPSFTTGQPPGE